jgi:hypothetical protein
MYMYVHNVISERNVYFVINDIYMYMYLQFWLLKFAISYTYMYYYNSWTIWWRLSLEIF